MQFYASCPRGLEGLLIDELKSYGVSLFKEHPTHVEFEGELEVAYKACMHSRIANRIFYCLLDQQFTSIEELYNKVNTIEWSWHFDIKHTFAVDCVARKSSLIDHSGFGALKVKDAIVDYFRERYEDRPSVDKDNPDYRVHALVNGSQLKIGLDLAGRSLHQRGYRDASGRAPIKENLAAAMLLRAKWPQLAEQGYAFHDPMCGTATLLIEAAMMATDMAPGLMNPSFCFESWKQHQPETWAAVVASAKRNHQKKLQSVDNLMIGSEMHTDSLKIARANVERAGFSELIKIEKQDINSPRLEPFEQKGLLVTNPPYGERLGNEEQVTPVYRALGDYIKKQCNDWTVAMITTETSYARAMGIRSHKQYKLKNGSLDCQLFMFEAQDKNFYRPFDPSVVNPQWDNNLSDGAIMLKNRLIKNLKRFKSYLKQNEISCYRLYDADLPEYSALVDVFEDEVYIQEYSAPKSIPVKVTQKRLAELVRVCSGVLQIPEKGIHVQKRQQDKNDPASNKTTEDDTYKVVTEQNAKFNVNLERYHDTGLVLDYRKIRSSIMKEAKGKRFLSLFAGNATLSACAAVGGAKTTSVEMSKAYKTWSMKNFSLNNVSVYGHEFVQQDCFDWIANNLEQSEYDLICLDPPSFSLLKGEQENFDLQQDQLELVDSVMKMLSKNGKLYFINNMKKFELDKAITSHYKAFEVTAKTLPLDFQKSRNHHRCWTIEHK